MPEPIRITLDRFRRRVSEASGIPMRLIGVPPGLPGPRRVGHIVLTPQQMKACKSRLKRERRFPAHYKQFYPRARRRVMAGK